MSADLLFRTLQESKEHCAIIIDESGAVLGFLSLEDLIEEIMGNIYDEYDDSSQSIIKVNETTYLIDGSLPIQDFNKEFNTRIEKDSAQYNSIARYLTHHFQKLPSVNDSFEIAEKVILFTIRFIEKNRIQQIEVTFQTD